METPEPKNIEPRSGPLRHRKSKGEEQALIRCVGCRRHVWVPAEEGDTRRWCSDECRVERLEKERKKEERERERARLKKKGGTKAGPTTREDGRPGPT